MIIDKGIDIAENISNIKKKVEEICNDCKRSSEEIIIVGVSKNFPVEDMKICIENKIINFGENRVQEFLKKYDIINENSKWHMIGHLQTNKVKYIIDKVSLIHSLDTEELACEIQKRSEWLNIKVNALIQVNISGEKSKFGINANQIYNFIDKIRYFPNLKIKGLMTIAPHGADITTVRKYFKEMKDLYIDITNKRLDNINMDILSMGMTNDFEVAIQEGSNLIRIGTAIFGERYKI